MRWVASSITCILRETGKLHQPVISSSVLPQPTQTCPQTGNLQIILHGEVGSFVPKGSIIPSLDWLSKERKVLAKPKGFTWTIGPLRKRLPKD